MRVQTLQPSAQARSMAEAVNLNRWQEDPKPLKQVTAKC